MSVSMTRQVGIIKLTPKNWVEFRVPGSRWELSGESRHWGSSTKQFLTRLVAVYNWGSYPDFTHSFFILLLPQNGVDGGRGEILIVFHYFLRFIFTFNFRYVSVCECVHMGATDARDVGSSGTGLTGGWLWASWCGRAESRAGDQTGVLCKSSSCY